MGRPRSSTSRRRDFLPAVHEWTRYEFDRDIDPEAVDVWWGVFLKGGGSAWFDGLEITIDGLPLEQGPPPVFGEPSDEQLDWIRNAAIPLTGSTPGEGYEDLRPLKNLVRNARIVALGEATHGTSEFFRMKHRILEFLANEMGFTIFSIEANMPEAYRVNDFVLTGQGDPKALLKGMYFWTWNTQEVLDMILWMRDFNQSGKGRIEFTGFDMQTPNVAMQIVRDFCHRERPGRIAGRHPCHEPDAQCDAWLWRGYRKLSSGRRGRQAVFDSVATSRHRRSREALRDSGGAWTGPPASSPLTTCRTAAPGEPRTGLATRSIYRSPVMRPTSISERSIPETARPGLMR